VTEFDKPTMGGVEIEKQPVCQHVRHTIARALDRKLKYDVSTVAMTVDAGCGGCSAADQPVGAERNACEHVGLYPFGLGAQLAPGNHAIPVAIQAEDIFEIAQRDVPLPGGGIRVKREITVAGYDFYATTVRYIRMCPVAVPP